MDIAQIYDQLVADHFDEDLFQIYQDAREQALAQMQGRAPQGPFQILDLGMGTGEWLLKFVERFPAANCNGVELSEKMIGVARRKFSERDCEVKIIHEDANHFGKHIPEATLQVITVHFVLNYIDRKRVIAEALRSLSPSGLFSVASSTHDSFAALHEIAKQFLPAEFIKAQMLIPEDLNELEADLKAVGFRILRGEMLQKAVRFEDFDHFYHFAMHSGWLADPILLKHMSDEHLGMFRELGKSVFPLEDNFQAAIVLAEKPK